MNFFYGTKLSSLQNWPMKVLINFSRVLTSTKVIIIRNLFMRINSAIINSVARCFLSFMKEYPIYSCMFYNMFIFAGIPRSVNSASFIHIVSRAGFSKTRFLLIARRVIAQRRRIPNNSLWRIREPMKNTTIFELHRSTSFKFKIRTF